MKLASFRLRVALLSAALAGSALVGFGAVSWFQIYEAKVSRLDAELFNHLMRASRPSNRERWQFYRESLSYAFGANIKIPIALLVLDANGDAVYQSEEVVSNFEVNRLLFERLKLVPQPPLPPILSKPFARNQPPPFTPPPSPQFVTLTAEKEAWRVGAVKFPNTGVAIAVSLQAVNQEMVTIRNIFLVSIPGALLLVASGAWLVSGRALRPIHQLTGVIKEVTVKGLDRRISVGSTDVEFVELIQVFNQMLERLERSFTQASRFSGDAAHELKTPLTILQGELERMLQQVDSGSELQQCLSNMLDEVSRLSTIMRKLLLLSLADAGQMSLYLVCVDMSGLLMEMLEDMELLAPHLTVEINIASGLYLQGDRDLLIQVLQNLLDNAIKYNIAYGWIQIRAYQAQNSLYVTIINSSIDIQEDDRPRIFDRFYRGDPARTRKVEGTGLGLSLAREIARAHRGDLTLDSTSPGQTGFTLTLPTP